jgi:hypothetical protein
MPLPETHSHVPFAFPIRSEVVRHKAQHVQGLTTGNSLLKRDRIDTWSHGLRRVLPSGQSGSA